MVVFNPDLSSYGMGRSEHHMSCLKGQDLSEDDMLKCIKNTACMRNPCF